MSMPGYSHIRENGGEGLSFCEMTADPSSPQEGKWKFYFLAGGPQILDDAGVITQLFDFPENHIARLITSNNGTDAPHDIDVAVGECRSFGDAENIVLASAITKQIDATWSVGNNAGGLAAGDHPVTADTLYAVWVIKRTDTGVVDVLFATEFTSGVVLPTGYDEARLIGSVLTDNSANILKYVQKGDWFNYDLSVLDVNDNAIVAGTFVTATLSAPPCAIVQVGMSTDNQTLNTANLNEVRLRASGSSAAAGPFNTVLTFKSDATNSVDIASGMVLFDVDSNSELEYEGSEPSGTQTVSLLTRGFFMSTRRDP